MKTSDLPVYSMETELDGMHRFDATIYMPALHKSKYRQRSYVIDLRSTKGVCLEVDLTDAANAFNAQCDRLKRELDSDFEVYPYGFSTETWPGYCLAPHSYLPLGESSFQVGLNLYGQFLQMDWQMRSAHFICPAIKDAFLCTTNWVDPDTRELWFASWAMADTFRRVLDPTQAVEGKIWKYNPDSQCLEQIWEGSTGDSLHQLVVSPDGRFVILCELGLYPKHPIPPGSFETYPDQWDQVRQQGLSPSNVLILDLLEGREWRLLLPTAAHIEFDPLDPTIFYLSSHNIGIIEKQVAIFGPGNLKAYRLEPDGPRSIAAFSSKDYFRVTTHVVFRHRDRTLIAVTGYPDTVFLVDAETMELYKKIALGRGEKVSLARHPHLCNQDSYGLAPSADGERLYVGETGRFRVIDIDREKTECSWDMDLNQDDWCFTGHILRHPDL